MMKTEGKLISIYSAGGKSVVERYVSSKALNDRLKFFPVEPYEADFKLCLPGFVPPSDKIFNSNEEYLSAAKNYFNMCIDNAVVPFSYKTHFYSKGHFELCESSSHVPLGESYQDKSFLLSLSGGLTPEVYFRIHNDANDSNKGGFNHFKKNLLPVLLHSGYSVEILVFGISRTVDGGREVAPKCTLSVAPKDEHMGVEFFRHTSAKERDIAKVLSWIESLT